MGSCFSKADLSNERKIHVEIENQIKQEKEVMKKQVKILLLGAGESGKSTIVKQMKLIHGQGYSTEEKEHYKTVVWSNTVQSIKALIEGMKKLSLHYQNEENEKYSQLIETYPIEFESETFTEEMARMISSVWHDHSIQACFHRSKEFQLNDSAKYFLDSVDRIASSDYLPTDQDVLRTRVKTTGINEIVLNIENFIYRMIDVGGQRSERKKWIHCFEDVTALLFMVAISEYDQKLLEDDTTNRMIEALTLFESIANSQWFRNSYLILFLNKIDIFRKKIQTSPIERYFSDYAGGKSYDNACEYFHKRFCNLCHNPGQTVYAHFTCATDTSQVEFVMRAVNDMLLQDSLRNVGLV